MIDDTQRIFLLRHGETAWARDGRHTGPSDIPLTELGERQAAAAGHALRSEHFGLVLCSPLQRARRTCDLAGFGDDAIIDDDCQEWNYGAYNGKTLAEIREQWPGWIIWNDGVVGGESVGDVGARADRVIARIRNATTEDTLIVAHGHFLRIFSARWLEFAPVEGRRLEMLPAAISVLGHERGIAALARWNDRSHLKGLAE